MGAAADATVASVSDTEKTVFARKTSGLVKDLGAFESFSINLISLGPGPAFGLFLIILVFVTGANLMDSVLLAALIAVPIIVTYTLIGIEMPRSGGEYVYSSRQLHPYFGILSAFGRLLNVIVYAAVLPYWFSTLSVGPGVAVWGAFTHNTGLLNWGNNISLGVGSLTAQGELYISIIGILATLVAMALWILMKPKLAFRIFSGLLILEIFGILLSVGLLLALGHTGFVNAVNNFTGDPTYYQDVSAYGAANFGAYGSSVTNTILFVPLLFAFYFMFGTAPSYIAGEFKRSTRSITYGMAISFLMAVIFAVLIVYTFEQIVGMNFLNGSVSFTDYFPTLAPVPANIPGLPFAMGLTSAPAFAAHGSSIALAIIMLGSASWYLLWLILGFYIFSRFMLSMSLDRLVPKWMGNVTRSTHQPWVGILVIGVFGIILLPILAYNYTALYTPFVFLLFFLPMITVMLTSLSLARLGIRNKKPLNVIAGGASFVVTLVAAYLVSTLPLLGGAAGFTPSNKETGAIIIASVFIGAGVLYLISRWYNQRSRGIDIGLAFKELPPD
jgi:basic amino acid/polyamine antiporter, APA family